MSRTVSQKMGIKEGMRAFILNAPEPARIAMELPPIRTDAILEGEFDYLHLFAYSQSELDDVFPRLKSHLRRTGMLWVSWPKGRRLGTDLTLPKVVHIGYNHGLVESICLSVDSTWSALKFTHPKPGKIYNNRHGRLPDS